MASGSGGGKKGQGSSQSDLLKGSRQEQLQQIATRDFQELRAGILEILQCNLPPDEFEAISNSVSPLVLFSAIRSFIRNLQLTLQMKQAEDQAADVEDTLTEEERRAISFATEPKSFSLVPEVVAALQQDIDEVREENLKIEDIALDVEEELAYANARIEQRNSGVHRPGNPEQFLAQAKLKHEETEREYDELQVRLEREIQRGQNLEFNLTETQMQLAEIAEREKAYSQFIHTLPKTKKIDPLADRSRYVAPGARPTGPPDEGPNRNEWRRIMKRVVKDKKKEYMDLVTEKLVQEEQLNARRLKYTDQIRANEIFDERIKETIDQIAKEEESVEGLKDAVKRNEEYRKDLREEQNYFRRRIGELMNYHQELKSLWESAQPDYQNYLEAGRPGEREMATSYHAPE